MNLLPNYINGIVVGLFFRIDDDTYVPRVH